MIFFGHSWSDLRTILTSDAKSFEITQLMTKWSLFLEAIYYFIVSALFLQDKKDLALHEEWIIGAMSVLRNERKCKYVYIHFQMNK